MEIIYRNMLPTYGQYSYFESLYIVIFKPCLLLRTTHIYQERIRQDIQLLKQAYLISMEIVILGNSELVRFNDFGSGYRGILEYDI